MVTNSAINTTNPISVTSGGTGRASLTNHGVLVGANTTSITQLSLGTNGQVLIGASAADPAFATLTSTAGSITYTTGANTLNLDIANYASTTWTPVLQFGNANVGITYSAQIGTYTRIGNLVSFTCTITLTNKGSSTGTATIIGLPSNSTNGWISNIMPLTGLTFAGQLISYNQGGTIVIGDFNTSGTFANITNTGFTNSSSFLISGFYIVAG